MLVKPDVRDIIITLWLLCVNSKEIYLCQSLLIVYTECFPRLALKHDVNFRKFIEPPPLLYILPVCIPPITSVVWGQKLDLSSPGVFQNQKNTVKGNTSHSKGFRQLNIIILIFIKPTGEELKTPWSCSYYFRPWLEWCGDLRALEMHPLIAVTFRFHPSGPLVQVL